MAVKWIKTQRQFEIDVCGTKAAISISLGCVDRLKVYYISFNLSSIGLFCDVPTFLL